MYTLYIQSSFINNDKSKYLYLPPTLYYEYAQDLILQILEQKIMTLTDKEGIVIVGFPRDVIQAQTFEEKVLLYMICYIFIKKFKTLLR